MKYCKHCGNQIPDNAVCNCPGAVAERQAQGARPAGGYQPQGYQPVQQRPVANNPMNGFAAAFVGYFKSPIKTVRERQRAKDLITPLIMLGAMFFLLWGVNSCIYGNQEVIIKFHKFNFGFVVLASFIETVVMLLSYFVAKFVLGMIFVKPANAGKYATDAFISFGVHSIVPLIAMVVGGLFYMANGIIAQIFFGFALVWYIAMGLTELNEEVAPQKKNFVFYLTCICLISLVVFGYIMMYKLMFLMNMGAEIENVNGAARAIIKSRMGIK